ncbi:MAG: hypothetical protein NC299_17910 [Lachnospiraceae bacterium]|nr:hypothetical protein [Ruminococcus sp.]MCM1277204.1 hypothetical protein [Lachnospiraceae bacterium]
MDLFIIGALIIIIWELIKENTTSPRQRQIMREQQEIKRNLDKYWDDYYRLHNIKRK